MFCKKIKDLHPAASEQNSESCGTTSQLSLKRKARKTPASPRKRQRSASDPAQLAFEAVPAKGCKRKASTEQGTLGKKCRPSCKNSDEAIEGTNCKKQDRAEKLPAPGTRKTKCTIDPSPGPSASTQNSGSASLRFMRNRARFEEKYIEQGMIGKGGFGSINAGRRKTDNLPVAIKHIRKRDVKCQKLVFNGKTVIFPREAFLMLKVGAGPASVGTSAVVAIIDWFELQGEVILVMERPDPCVNLLNYMEYSGGPLEEDVAKNIMKQLVAAALMMHTNGVFHSDIKAENLLIETNSNDPRVWVIDFGCGCLIQEEPYSSFSGTRAYAPPELFIHKRYEAEPTTVWQLGALLYDMLIGPRHFSTNRFLRKKLKFNTGMSQDCQNFMRQCLASDPQQRATLKRLQLHPWLQNQVSVTPQTPGEMPGL